MLKLCIGAGALLYGFDQRTSLMHHVDEPAQ